MTPTDLRRELERRDLSQVDLMRLLRNRWNVDSQAVSLWCTGKTAVPYWVDAFLECTNEKFLMERLLFLTAYLG